MAKKIVEKWISYKDAAGRYMWIVPIVNPEGVIKYPRVSPVVQSAIVTCKWHDPDGKAPALMAVQMQSGMDDRGWAFIADEFSAVDAVAAWTAFCEDMSEGPMCIEGSKRRPFPEKYLPQGIKDRRMGIADHQALPDEIVIPELDAREAAGHASTSKRKARAAGLDLDAA